MRFPRRGHWRRATEAGHRRQQQAADLWLAFGTDEAARLVGIPPRDLLALVIVASYHKDG